MQTQGDQAGVEDLNHAGRTEERPSQAWWGLKSSFLEASVGFYLLRHALMPTALPALPPPQVDKEVWCQGRSLLQVPSVLSRDIEVLNLSGNQLRSILALPLPLFHYNSFLGSLTCGEEGSFEAQYVQYPQYLLLHSPQNSLWVVVLEHGRILCNSSWAEIFWKLIPKILEGNIIKLDQDTMRIKIINKLLSN